MDHFYGAGQQGTQQWGQQQWGTQQYGGTQQTQQFGAHELLKTHEILSHKINTINVFELLTPHIKDTQLRTIFDNQLRHIVQGYETLVNFIHQRGAGRAMPYHGTLRQSVKYGLRNPSPSFPNANPQQMDDRDVASIMMSCAKSTASMCTHAALECADNGLRQMMLECITSACNQHYEIFQFMNQKGYYQVPTLQQNTTNTMVNSYQAGGGVMPQGVM
ncbi:MAG: spore coat protein [Clostridia bacterium]|nr:spore coat protein [Clostridia bacterium]